MLKKIRLISKADLLSLLGGIIYSIELWLYIRSSFCHLDESAYIYKGYLFATGQYQPFGPAIWTNKAPFSFLIPGYIQLWFGPGLRSARYFAFLIGVLILLGVWLTARRLSGKWWGAAAVWFFVLSPVLIRLYSIAVSQGLVALMLIWILALSLGGDRPLWQLSLSAALAGIMLLTRQNMVVVLPMLVLYIFWQYGRKAGMWSLFSGVMVVAIGHAIWWPRILRLWDPWLPGQLSILISSFYISPESLSSVNFGNSTRVYGHDLSSVFMSFFRTYRSHAITMTGVLVSLFLWNWNEKKWKNKKVYKDAIFLAILFWVLFGMHAWASLGKNYCIHCLAIYFGFFSVSGILLIVVSAPSWKKKLPSYFYPFLVILVLIITTGIGYASLEDLGDYILQLQIPRVKNGQFLSGSVDIMTALANKFQLTRLEARIYTSLSAGFIFGAGFLIIVASVKNTYLRKKNFNLSYLTLISFFFFSVIAAPFIIGADRIPDYDGDIILSYEEAGSYLAEYIPAGSTVYWHGSTSMLPLLYIPGGVEIYAPQLNAYNNYRKGGDPDIILSLGYWNDILMEEWKSEAEYIVLINYLVTEEWDVFLDPSQFDEFPKSSTLLDNRKDSFLRVFRRK